MGRPDRHLGRIALDEVFLQMRGAAGREDVAELLRRSAAYDDGEPFRPTTTRLRGPENCMATSLSSRCVYAHAARRVPAPAVRGPPPAPEPRPLPAGPPSRPGATDATVTTGPRAAARGGRPMKTRRDDEERRDEEEQRDEEERRDEDGEGR
ncbi:hypothetical protein GCM10014715_05220 [Streptomyces spiralis]|uniref:Uncharacterized protein n=1 Tax=Streptomyces spiralis TaxID=66376 RepID=A0A918ZIY5_9ACTN|nr:hypothetical protein GCM10014715_05220 [Streptomyces spiralis]